MSLDCYPLGQRRTIDLVEQPLALDVAYNDDLLISTSNQCRTINIHDLTLNDGQGNLYRKFSLGTDIILDQVVYCKTGDYIACIGDKNGIANVYIILGWRTTLDEEPNIMKLNLDNAAADSNNDRSSQLNCIDCCQRTGNLAISNGELILIYKYKNDDDISWMEDIINDENSNQSRASMFLENPISSRWNQYHGDCTSESQSESQFEHIISVRLSICAMRICLLENYLSITAADHVQVLKLELLKLVGSNPNQLADDCITWNLNTKKLVKLPTLMHNTSSNLSSYYICHPLELLGPASESIACRVSASIYSPDFSQNQLEAVVMLCKQFDFDRDPIKSAHLQPVYLSSVEDQRRISKSASALVDYDSGCDQASGCGREVTLLKSADYELLASVNCFVCTLANCFVYSLHGKRVLCSQTITHPDLCLDMRPDLLNVYLLTPLGLQICSSGICDTIFRYDWSSSSDLNLSFIATDRMRVLTTKTFVILISCSVNGQCELEYLEKPHLDALLDRIVDTVNHCNSISIRANMLTYLHASAHLALIADYSERSNASSSSSTTEPARQAKRLSIVSNLKSITLMLCKQLLQKRQTNVITNNRIDKAIKHLLDISMCDLSELMRRHMLSESEKQTNHQVEQLPNNEEDEADKPLDTDYELIRIYLKHSKYSQWLLDYLVSISRDENMIRRVIDYIFEQNPKLLIKSAQGYPLIKSDDNEDEDEEDDEDEDEDDDGDVDGGRVASSSSSSSSHGATDRSRTASCMRILVEKLEQLVEFDSTGIDRATVLFTLAALYNALQDKQKCLAALAQIKPSNHLAITMCSNYDLGLSMANVVSENYPDVYALYLRQLAKRDRLVKSIPQDRNHG